MKDLDRLQQQVQAAWDKLPLDVKAKLGLKITAGTFMHSSRFVYRIGYFGDQQIGAFGKLRDRVAGTCVAGEDNRAISRIESVRLVFSMSGTPRRKMKMGIFGSRDFDIFVLKNQSLIQVFCC
jgi:hypothetical protein